MTWLQRKPHGLMGAHEDEGERPALDSPALPSARDAAGVEDVVANSQDEENDEEANAGGGDGEEEEDAEDEEGAAFDRWMRVRRRRNRVNDAPSDDGADSDDDERTADHLQQQIAEFEVQRERDAAINQLDRLMQEDDDDDSGDDNNGGGGEDANDNNGGNDDDHFSFNGSDRSDSDSDDDDDDDGFRQDFGLDAPDDDHDDDEDDEDEDENAADAHDAANVAADRPADLPVAHGNGAGNGFIYVPLHRQGHDPRFPNFFDNMRMRMNNGLIGGPFFRGNAAAHNIHGGGNAGEQQEIDLTALSSDSEDGRNDDDDDEVEIVGTALPVAPPPRGRKRRRVAPPAAAAAPSPFDTASAESTNISMENNEVIERFKSSLKCSVCLDVIQDMTSTICGHVYCNHCIRLAIRVTQKCPLCQRPLQPTDIHGLYF